VQWVFVAPTARNSAVGIKDIETNSAPGRFHPFGGVTPLWPTKCGVGYLPSLTQRIAYVILYVCRGRKSTRALLDAPDNSGAFQILR
jgi:hypothetical protein